MALFNRRVIQKCLDVNADFVSDQHLKDWVQRLNRSSEDSIATEWEIVLLRAFANFGTVLHEPNLGDRRLDLVFESVDFAVKFAADITAISDQPRHDRNPIDRFQDELRRPVEKAGIGSGRFIFRVAESQPVPFRGSGRQRRLLLPAIKQFQTCVFNSEFRSYLDAVRSEPQQNRDHHIHDDSHAVDILIQYQPGRGRGVGSASYGSYTTTTVKDNNPLFNALKTKANQLKHSAYSGTRGIIVCDRGSRIFNENPNWSNYAISEIVSDFFRQNGSVDFVLTIGIRQRSMTGNKRHSDYEKSLFVRDTCKKWTSNIERLFEAVISSLPEIYQTPENAANSLKHSQTTKTIAPFLGGSTLIGNEIRISARELLDLLAGRLEQKRFAENHDLGGGNIFSLYQAKGKLIKRAEIEVRPEEDDDWLILEFSEGDPAVSKFKVPDAHSRSRAMRKPGDLE